jgi:hypothetical protein
MRSGAWIKYRNRGQELVIGGYMAGAHGLDSIIFGFYKEHDLINVARVRNRFAWGGPLRCQGKGFSTLPIVD